MQHFGCRQTVKLSYIGRHLLNTRDAPTTSRRLLLLQTVRYSATDADVRPISSLVNPFIHAMDHVGKYFASVILPAAQDICEGIQCHGPMTEAVVL